MKYTNKINGIIAVNKPYGKTSRAVVEEVQKIFNTKAGHTGTLDPIATGVLIVCLGKYTKLSNYITSDTKEYMATVKFGILTDTLDITGKVLARNSIYPDKCVVQETLKKFIGTYTQEVPVYSAVKVEGRKLYEYARAGLKISLPKRHVTIYSIELLNYNNEGFTFACKVSKGTYIRSLIRDICAKMNCYGTMEKLVRTSQCGISIEHSYTIENIKNNHYKILDINDIMNVDIKVANNDLKNKILNGVRQTGNRHTLFVDINHKKIALYKYNGKDLEMWVKLYEDKG